MAQNNFNVYILLLLELLYKPLCFAVSLTFNKTASHYQQIYYQVSHDLGLGQIFKSIVVL